MTKMVPLKELEKRVICLMIKDPEYKESRSGNWKMFRYLEAKEGMEFIVNGKKVDAKWLAENMFPIDNIRRVNQILVASNAQVYGPTSEKSNQAASQSEMETLDYVRSSKQTIIL